MVLLTRCIDVEEAFFYRRSLAGFDFGHAGDRCGAGAFGGCYYGVFSAAPRHEGLSPVATGLALALAIDARPLVMVAGLGQFCDIDWVSDQYDGLWSRGV